ncbi:unnamed protein product, partial [Cladocopium goreaui]
MISQFCLVSAVLASLRALGGGLGPSWGPASWVEGCSAMLLEISGCPVSFQKCCRGPLKALLDYDEGLYWQVAKHLGVGIKVWSGRIRPPDQEATAVVAVEWFWRDGRQSSARVCAKVAQLRVPMFQASSSKRGESRDELVNDKDKLLRGGATPGDGRTQEDQGQLVHLTGARSLLSLWILADHFAHRASVFTDRANVAVNSFIMMSGFVTQWAYGSRDLSRCGPVAQFLV